VGERRKNKRKLVAITITSNNPHYGIQNNEFERKEILGDLGQIVRCQYLSI